LFGFVQCQSTSNQKSVIPFSGTVLPGVSYNHTSAKVTVLNNVVIQEAEGFGIYQIGGRAELQNIRITGTRTAAGSVWVGSGALFADSAEVTLTDFVSEMNQSCGIVIDGPDTSVVGIRLGRYCTRRRHWRPCQGQWLADHRQFLHQPLRPGRLCCRPGRTNRP